MKERQATTPWMVRVLRHRRVAALCAMLATSACAIDQPAGLPDRELPVPAQDLMIGSKRILATGALVRGTTTYPAAVLTYDQAMDDSDAGSNPGIELWQDITLSKRFERSNDNNGQWDYVIAGAYFADGQAVVYGTRYGSHAPQDRTWRSSGSYFLSQTSGWPPLTWSAGASMQIGRQWPAMAAIGGKVMVFGGFAGYSLLDEETVEETPSPSGAWSFAAAMPAARYAGMGAQVIGGNVYVLGGFAYPAVPSGSVYRYDPGANSWASVASLPVAGGCGASASLATPTPRIFALVGCTGSSTYGSDFLSYDPATDTWTTLVSPAGLHVYGSAVSVGGKVYVISGISDASNSITTSVEVYDPATGTWSSAAPIPTGRFGATAQVFEGKVWVIGGRTSLTTPSTVVEVFDPSTNTWSVGPSLSTPRADPGSAVVDGRIVVAGGSNGGLLYYSTTEVLGRS